MTAVPPVVSLFTSASPVLAADDSGSVGYLVDQITSNTTQRQEAAQRLVANDSVAAQKAVAGCLANSGKPLAQAAVAKALSQSSNPNPQFIQLLAQLLGSSPDLTRAAAPALANYRGNPEAFQKLTSFINIARNPNSIRNIAIRAMGSLIDRSAAEYLIDLLNAPSQSPSIQNAAAEALGEMTGLSASYGTDVRQWQQWWTGVVGKNQDQFQAMLLETRAGQFSRAEQRDTQLVDSMGKILEDYYNLSPENRKSAVIARYLNDAAPEVRAVGVFLIGINTGEHPPTDAIRAKLIAMVADTDANVRLKVVNVLVTLNDHSALNPLLEQLNVEKDTRIKIAIAQALTKQEDPAAVPALLKLLQDAQTDAKTEAAKSFSGSFGAKLRNVDPALADHASQEIRTVLAANAHLPGTADLRAACLSALAALRDKRSFDTFNDFLQPGETNEVRRAALLGLGNLGNTKADQIVANQLRDNNDKTVRLQAAKALQSVATTPQADQIFNLMNSDPDQEVRDALWVAFQNLYPKESPEDLEHWQAQFDNDLDKKLVTLRKLGDALAAKGDKEAVASNQQHLAEVLMNIAHPKPQEAIDNLQAALDYWQGPGSGDEVHLQTLVEQIMDAQLVDGRYTEAVAFAGKQITAKPEYGKPLSLKLVNKADDLLSRDNNLAGAQSLINELMKMTPPVDQKYVGKLQEIQADLKRRTPSPPAP